jgi:hypothetical protein
MKKIIITLSLLFLLSACNVPNEYSIELNPGKDIISVGEEFIDGGCFLYLNEAKYTMDVSLDNLDIDEIGEYEITYLKTIDEYSYQCLRIVKVIDDVKPVVTLNPGIDTIVLGSEHTDSGVTAVDNYSADLLVVTTSDLDVNQVGSYTIMYTVTDESNNRTIIIRYVTVIGLI